MISSKVLRADALASIYLFHPLERLFQKTLGLPILMYHSVADREEQTHPYYRTVTSPEVFSRQMQYLHENGYTAVSLDEAVRRLGSSISSGDRPVAITFDDGFQDFYTHAFPILSRYSFKSTMFLPTAFIGETTQTFKGVPCLTWGQVRELQRTGVKFGSHTVNHPQLRSLEESEIRAELRDSKEKIEHEMGSAVTSFAYPYAFPEADTRFTRALCRNLQESGYENGVSTTIGTAGSSCEKLFLRRLPVNSCDDSRLLEAKLRGGYDWLRFVQYASKKISKV